MARRSYNKKRGKKIQPAPLNLSFTVAGGTATNWIDLSQCASIVGRRFVRQGLNWAVAGFTVTVTGTTTSPGSVTISKFLILGWQATLGTNHLLCGTR